MARCHIASNTKEITRLTHANRFACKCSGKTSLRGFLRTFPIYDVAKFILFVNEKVKVLHDCLLLSASQPEMERDRRGLSLSANAMKFKTVPHDACAPAHTRHSHAHTHTERRHMHAGKQSGTYT